MFSEQDAHAIGVDASLDFYPLATMDLAWEPCTNIETGKERGTGPMNTLRVHREGGQHLCAPSDTKGDMTCEP